MYLYNAIRTPDGTILKSLHRHDYKTYTDANGLEYMVDGGRDYLRRNEYPFAPYTELSVSLQDKHDKKREHFTWGTRDKCNSLPVKEILLKDLSDNHILAILRTQALTSPVESLFKNEIMFRLTHNLYIEEGYYEK